MDREYNKLDVIQTVISNWRYSKLKSYFLAWRKLVKENMPEKVVCTPLVKQSDGRDMLRRSLSLVKGKSGVDIPETPNQRNMKPTLRKGECLIPGRTGLRNLGNTCFMNSVLTCLANLPEVKEFLVKQLVAEDQEAKSFSMMRRDTLTCLNQLTQRVSGVLEDISICEELHKLLRVIWSGKYSVVTPFNLLDAIWKCSPQFRGYFQQDSQEFFSFLVDRMETELKKSSNFSVSQWFGGSLDSEVECCECSNVSRREEKFLYLPLEIPVSSVAKRRTKNNPAENCSLEDCFDAFVKEEMLEDPYNCEKCEKKVTAKKRMVIKTLPNLFCVVLKRFCYNNYGDIAKNDTQVVCPQMGLNLCKYTENKNDIFEMSATVVHSGLNLTKGHYFSYGFSAMEEEWVCLFLIFSLSFQRTKNGFKKRYSTMIPRSAW